MADRWFVTASRAEILAAMIGASDHREQVMTMVSSATDDHGARAALMVEFGFSEVAATAVLDQQLRRFTQEGRQHLVDEWERTLAEL